VARGFLGGKKHGRGVYAQLGKTGLALLPNKQTPPAPFCLAQLPPDAILAAENPCGTPGTLRDGEGGDGSNWLKILIARPARDSIA
jgi:hypothetical protein